MTIRKLLFYIHQYLGLFAFVFLIAAGVTGVILVFKDELDASLNADLFRIQNAAQPAASALAIADQVQASHPDMWIHRVNLRGGEGASLQLGVGARDAAKPLGHNEMFVNPADGSLVGVRQNEPGWGRRQIVNGMFIFHANLLAGDFGRILMGIVAVGWTVSALAGLYLTFPQTAPFWRKWGYAWVVKLRSSLPRFMLDLHKASGLWLFIPTLLLAITSAALNFYYEAAEPVALALSPASPSPFDPGARSVGPGHKPAVKFTDIFSLAEDAAAKRAPNLEPTFAEYLPEFGLYSVAYVTKGADTYSSLGPVFFLYDDMTGAPVYVDDPYNDGAGRATLRSLYPLHSGRVWGWPTRILVLILGLATVEMSITGFYVWWRKTGRNLFKRREVQPSPAQAPTE
jgi:uncharacterized iron-regulated membrane protein